MRKLVSLGAVLFSLFGLAFLAGPAAALIPCDCEYCAGSPGGWCLDEGTGVRLRCYQYTELFCFGLSAPVEQKVASEPVKASVAEKKTSEPVFFPLELLGAGLNGRSFPGVPPVLKPGC